MNKPVKIAIGSSSDEIEKYIFGKIVKCTSSNNDSNAIAIIRVDEENGRSNTYSIFEIQNIAKV
jgi:hypothetical protein